MARNTNETRGGLNRKIRESSHKISWLVKSNIQCPRIRQREQNRILGALWNRQ